MPDHVSHRAEHDHLHGRGAEQPPAQPAELLEGKLEPDREEEQGDAQLRDEGDVLDVQHQVGHGRADDQSADDVAGDHRQPEEIGGEPADDGGADENDEFARDVGAAG